MPRLCTLALTIFICCSLLGCKRDHLYGETQEFYSPNLIKYDTSIIQNSLGFYMGIPVKYNEPSNIKRYPLILSLPGAAAYGSDKKNVDYVLSYGPIHYVGINSFPAFVQTDVYSSSFIVLAPQFVDTPSNNDIRKFLLFAEQNFRIDTTRIYIAGSSVGGRMASDYASEYADEIAALIVMGGCSDDHLKSRCEKLVRSNLPIWAFHNAHDEAWPIGSQKTYINTIISFQPDILPLFTIFQTGGGPSNHDCWTNACNPENKFDGVNIYEWLLRYSR